ncbi:hypothetical protein M404DRAFT_502090 [Pisolithus tinctorius Marx 270]|uniref:Uncharacterized protein n=1 Tax=Pisolithus tinctorius Marx 270 TaxID=870435 RepID=A0A0C3I8Q5_PISTI|nr:hypothetical protein M404DRAFT_502090 [Pisolithus tinctorius Marx 270]
MREEARQRLVDEKRVLGMPRYISTNPPKGTLIHQKTKCSHEFCSDDDRKGTIRMLSNSSTRIQKSERSGQETAARNLTKVVSPERAMRGERSARKARGTVLECARYDERTSRVGRRSRLAQQRLGRSTRNSGRR